MLSRNVLVLSLLCLVHTQIHLPNFHDAAPTIIRDVSRITLDNLGNLPFAGLLDIEEHVSTSELGDSACLTKIKSLVSNLVSSNVALRTESIYFFDAAGKPLPGMFLGNLLMMGSYDLCQTMSNASQGYYQPCYVHAPALIATTPISIDWTGCLPVECRSGSNGDVENYVNTVIAKLLFPGLLTLLPDQATIACESNITWDTGAYIATLYLSVVAFVVVTGTLWYLFDPIVKSLTSVEEDKKLLVECEEEENVYEGIAPDPLQNGVNLDKPPRAQHTEQPESVLSRVLKCFALQRSFGTLTSIVTKPGQVLCLNGIRVLSINWVVLGHTYLSFMSLAGDKEYFGTLLNRRNIPIILNAHPSVDTFFTLSGFLVAYLLLKQLASQGGMGPLKWTAYYCHRYLRLTMPYLAVILVEGFMYRQWVHGPFTVAFEGGHEACKKYWYANLLYINNMVPWKADKVCIGQTWYLSNDMQFFVMAPLFVVLLFRAPLAGLLTSVGTIVCSALTAAVLTYHYKLGPSGATDHNGDNFWLVYNKPWIRITPYIVGILGGWFYWKHGNKLQDRVQRMPAWKQALIAVPVWVVTCAIQWAVVFGLYDDIKLVTMEQGTASVADSISYESLARIAWSVTLTIQILACHSGLGGFINSILSWNGWLVLSRLTYSVYLLHLGLMQVMSTQIRHPFFFNPDFELGIWYLGLLLMSYLSAAVLYVCIEQPLVFVEALTYRKQK